MIVYVVFESKDFGKTITEVKAVLTSVEKAEALVEKLKAENEFKYYDFYDFVLDTYDEV